MTRALGRCLAGIDFLLTPRWNGPGKLRLKQEMIRMQAAWSACERANSGRSLD